MAMFGYMTEIDSVEMTDYQEIIAEGEDLLSLLYHFLDEFLFLFSADPFFIARVSSIMNLKLFMSFVVVETNYIQLIHFFILIHISLSVLFYLRKCLFS